MATSLDGHIIKPTSTPLDRLITEGYVPDENNQWDLVNVGFLLGKLAVLQGGVDADLLALFTMLTDSMGVKMITQNVALTGLFTFPDLTTYTPKNKERVLLIAQINPSQNGFYEWQTGGNLVRLYDWRDIIAGNGIAISNNNLAVDLLEYLPFVDSLPQRNSNFLRFVGGKLVANIAAGTVGLKLNANGELYLDEAELSGSGGGGASLLDVANPDIDLVRSATNGLAVYLPNTSGYVEVLGGNYRTATISPVTIISTGIANVIYLLRKYNKIQATITVNNLIGSHTLFAKHLTLQSNESDGSGNVEYNKITVLGAATIDTITPAAKRNNTTTVTVTGEGFAVLSTWASNNAGITIVAFRFITRLLIEVDISVANAVPSGLYNLVCNNAFSGLGSFTSGTSGNNKLQVFGDPQITTVHRVTGLAFPAEIGLGETVDVVANGYDLGTDPNVVAGITSNIFVNSISGTTTQKTINVTGSSDKAHIGIKNLLITDTTLVTNSGTSGNGKIALNYNYDNVTKRIPATFRSYGGAILADWTITSDDTSVTVTKTGGTGDCGLEITDLFLVASLLEFNLGGSVFGTTINIEVLTPAASIPSGNPLFVMIGQRGQNYSSGFGGTRDYALEIKHAGGSFYNYNTGLGSSSNTAIYGTAKINLSRFSPANTSRFISEILSSFEGAYLAPIGTNIEKTYTAHENKGLYISMQGNYSIKFNMRGWIGD